MKRHGSEGFRSSITRRQLIRAGGCGLFGLSLPRFLDAREQKTGPTPRAKSCIFIVLSGGLSHIDTFDPKPAAAAEIRGPYKPVSTSVPGVQITEMLPRLASLADRYTLIRSLSHRDTVHVTAAHTMLTGGEDGRRRDDTPFMGSLIAKFRPAEKNVPSYVWLHNMKTGTNKVPRYENGLHKIGYDFAPLRVGYELDNPSSPDFRVTHFDPPEGISGRQLEQRFGLLEQLQPGLNPDSQSPAPMAADEAADRYKVLWQRARALVTGPQARRAFDVNREPDRVRERYGRHPLGQYTLMARRLVEAGVPLVTVTAWPGLAPGETAPTITQVWDMHDTRYKKNDNMFGNGPFGMKWSLPRLDQAVSALLEDLDERGLLSETLVVLLGEFGRTPKFEGRGRGRGHWPNCYSGLLAGGGIQRGAVYGSSDAQGAYVAGGQPISHVDFGATLFHALGIPPETRYGPDGFSFRVNEGTRLRELFI